jgi:formate dehydrogenase alpha subunit
MPRFLPYEDANPFIVRDLTKCILCGRCIWVDRELVVVGAIDYQFRGFDAYPATLHREPLERSSCTFCGTCVAACPTGALRAKTPGYAGGPERWSPSVCGFCGAGCALQLGSAGGRVVEVEPGGRPETANGSTLCVRGRFEQDFLGSPDRLGAPRVKREGEQVPCSWEEALETATASIRAVRARSGPQSVAFLGSPSCTVEESYLFQKIARTLVGTNHVLLDGEVDPVADRLTGMQPLEMRRLEEAEAVVVAGIDPTEALPVLGYALKRAARWKDVPLVVVDSLRTGLVPFARSWLPAWPDGYAEVLDALAAAVLERTGEKAPERDGYEGFARFVAGHEKETVCRRNGIHPGALERAADALAGKQAVFVTGRRALGLFAGTRTLRSLRNLSLVTGAPAASSAYLFPACECNRTGALDMGVSRDLLPGRMPLREETGRRYWEQAWGVRLSPDPGLTPARLIREIEQGNLRALMVLGANPARSFPQPRRVREALAGLDLLVVQDILETGTAAQADVVLPGAAFGEKEGTFVNLEGRVQAFRPAVPAPGEARPDWSILGELFRRLSGTEGRYGEIADIREEVRRLVPGYEAVPFGEGEGSPRFRGVPPGSPEDLLPFEASETIPGPSENPDFPLWAVLGSPRCHAGSGTRTSRSARAAALEPMGGLEVSREDSEQCGLEPGDRARVVSAWGAVERVVELGRRVRPGLVEVATGVRGNVAMELMPLEDGATPPGACRVRIEKT